MSYLLVGLGNPGTQYELTYHNVGFVIIDNISKYWGFRSFHKKIDYLVTYGFIKTNKTILVKPYSFMNNSGTPVAKVQNLYKLSLDNILVIHDDADLEPGKIKIKKGGGSSGHNGVKSIDDFIGRDYWRLRFGIGRPPKKQKNLGSYLLSEHIDLKKNINLIEKIAKNIYLVLQKESTAFIRSLLLK